MRNRKKAAEKNLDFAEYASKQAQEGGQEAEGCSDEWEYISPETLRDRRTYTKHGLTTVRKNLKSLSAVLDRRTVEAKFVKKWQADIIAELGGPEKISTAKKTLVQLASMDFLYLLLAQRQTLSLPSIFDQQTGGFLNIVMDQEQIAERLARKLSMLGLERKVDKPDLARMLKEASKDHL